MTLKEIIHNEDLSGNQIHLYREGLSYKEQKGMSFVFNIDFQRVEISSRPARSEPFTINPKHLGGNCENDI